MGTKVRNVMSNRPRCVSPDTPVSKAAELMESEDVGALPVLEGDDVTRLAAHAGVARAHRPPRPKPMASAQLGGERQALRHLRP
jgi:CBS domain-containing protein